MNFNYAYINICYFTFTCFKIMDLLDIDVIIRSDIWSGLLKQMLDYWLS